MSTNPTTPLSRNSASTPRMSNSDIINVVGALTMHDNVTRTADSTQADEATPVDGKVQADIATSIIETVDGVRETAGLDRSIVSKIIGTKMQLGMGLGGAQRIVSAVCSKKNVKWSDQLAEELQ